LLLLYHQVVEKMRRNPDDKPQLFEKADAVVDDLLQILNPPAER